MLVAAYLVGGFLIASVYAVGHAARPARPLPPARLHHPVHRRRDRDADPDGRRRHAGAVGLQQRAGEVRRDRAGAEDGERRARDAVRPPERRTARSAGGIPIPGLASILSDPSTGTSTRRSQGLRHACPVDDAADDRARSNVVHLAWDVMVGLGTLLFLLSLWYGAALAVPARHARRRKWFLRIAAVRRRARRWSRMEAGWVVTEVGRQPWIVHNYMKVEDAATANTGVWITFLVGRRASTSALGVTTILVLRGMSRRWRERRRRRRRPTCPYGPSDRRSGADAPRARCRSR